ncbi:MAG: aminotransferase class I/II-fold pyridoxal phosphate-dependent enzyme [Spirochaetes bacterium]|nr:aminotransferase class I/II-fold pyridoxal phosphate-dependent enzyme [Spirochaetota bacterium]
MIAKRMAYIDSSGIRKVFNLASKMKDPVNLSIGQPDFDTPDRIKESAIKAIREGKNKYTLTQGITELNRKILETYQKRYTMNPPQSVMITSGTSGGILLSFLCLVNPGDEVLIPDPYFVMYKHLTHLVGGRVVFYNTYPDFKIKEKHIRDKITDKTRIIIINSPNNPTGMVYSHQELEIINKVAQEHDLFIISDEIYDSYVYDDEYTSMLDITNNALVLKGYSKNFSIPGWRIGFALGPDWLISEMIKLQQFSFVCAPSFAQYAVLDNLDFDLKTIKNDYKEKRDAIYSLLKDDFEIQKPGGAFYIFPRTPSGQSGTEFVTKAIEHNLLIIPGNVFSESDTHFRISFAASIKDLKRGAEILIKIKD